MRPISAKHMVKGGGGVRKYPPSVSLTAESLLFATAKKNIEFSGFCLSSLNFFFDPRKVNAFFYFSLQR